MNEITGEMTYQQRVNVALEEANAYIQRYYLDKRDPRSEDRADICIIRSMRRAISALMEELSEKSEKDISTTDKEKWKDVHDYSLGHFTKDEREKVSNFLNWLYNKGYDRNGLELMTVVNHSANFD